MLKPMMVEKQKFSQAFAKLVSCFRHLSKDNSLQPCKSQLNSRRGKEFMFLTYVIKNCFIVLKT